MEKIRKLIIMVVDDDRKSIDYLCGLLGQLGLNTDTIITETDSLRAFRYLRNNPVDLLFLDVEMPNLNGLSLLEALPSKPPAILTTAYPQYAMDAYTLGLPECIRKPIELPRLIRAIDRTLGLLFGSEKKMADGRDHVYVTDLNDKSQLKLFFDDIYFIEVHHNEITIHLSHDKIMARTPIKDFLAKLPPDKFIQVHRSYVVSLDKVYKFHNKRSKIYVMRKPDPIPLSDTYRAEFIAKHNPGLDRSP